MDRAGASRRAEAAAPTASSRDRILLAAKSLFARLGYESASTVAIARQAGTSESQLMKHFGSKEGLLEAIFDAAWQKLNSRIRQAFQRVPSPRERLRALAGLVMTTLEGDPDLKLLMLLEGRRIRKEGHMVVLTRGFLEFVGLLDQVLAEMKAAGQLHPDAHPAAVRSALMGSLEGLLRDQLLARRTGFPARYNNKQLRQTFETLLASFIAGPPPEGFQGVGGGR